MEWEFELVAGPYGGPVYGAVWDGNALLFSVPSQSLILRYSSETGAITEFRRYAQGIKGLAFDDQGHLYGCQSSSRRIVRFNRDGSTSPMEYRFEGKFHNYPYDLTIDHQGRIWFSDPVETGPIQGPQLQGSLDHQSVLRLERRGDGSWRIRRMSYDTQSPHAVLLSTDERTLYVSENSDDIDGKRELRAYPIQDDDTLGAHRVLHTFGADAHGLHRGIDGMCMDSEGNIIACGGWQKSGPGPMIYVFAPSGRILESHPVPADQPVKCAFGDADLRALYVTTGEGRLYRVHGTGHRGCCSNRACPVSSPESYALLP
ncbi:MAG: SMP-30/gluconolactonase/LRE family protein [Deltaproteobacteria bacterium]|nr:SMP-30/gluconolactonase/LRE family protein [Deltaproteobacteria bacterium]